MCIICVKAKNVNLPSTDTIKTMFRNNKDGAGFMYNKNGQVRIRKGFMTCDALLDALDELSTQINIKETAMVLHFRIGTGGGNVPANTHPYPVSSNLKLLQSLNTKTDLGVAHNGIIDITPRQKDINDTMEYIMSQLAPLKRGVPDFYRNKDLMTMVKNAITSKMAFLNGEGQIYTIGDFIQEKDGLMYSNDSYKPWSSRLVDYSKFKSYGYDSYGWNWDYCYDKDEVKDWRLTTDAETNSSGLCMKAQEMMWLDEDEYVIVRGDDGTDVWYDGFTSELLIDEDDEVYTYSVEKDCCIYLGGTAYTPEHQHLHFDYSRANVEYVEVFEENWEVGANDGK